MLFSHSTTTNIYILKCLEKYKFLTIFKKLYYSSEYLLWWYGKYNGFNSRVYLKTHKKLKETTLQTKHTAHDVLKG